MEKQNIKVLFPANMSYPIISIGSFYRSKNKGGGKQFICGGNE